MILGTFNLDLDFGLLQTLTGFVLCFVYVVCIILVWLPFLCCIMFLISDCETINSFFNVLRFLYIIYDKIGHFMSRQGIAFCICLEFLCVGWFVFVAQLLNILDHCTLPLVAVHSDAWLLDMAFYFAARFGFDKVDRCSFFPLLSCGAFGIISF